MNTTDNQADQQQTDGDNFTGLGGEGGAIDNDAYGRQNDDQSAPAETAEDIDDSEGLDENEQQRQTPQTEEDEEQEFYWDGAPLESPTSTDDGDANDTPLIKQLRQTIKEQRAQLRDKGLTPPAAPQAQAAAPLTLPPYPKMEDDGIDYDPEIFAQKVREWHETEGRVKAQQQQQEQQQQQLVQTFNERKQAYKDRVSTMKVRGYEDAEAFVAGEISQEVQAALILHAEKPELVVLALARNADLLKQAKSITDPVKLGMLIGMVEAKAKALPKGKKAVNGVPPSPRGNGGGQLRDLDSEIEKARNSGDYSRVIALKKQRSAAAKK